jgi:hypothetical protein
MTMNGSRINGKLIQIVFMVSMALYIIADKALAPLIANVTGKAASQAKIVSDAKIFQLEVVISKLGNLSETVAAQSEAILGLKTSVDRVERKLDTHIGK